MTGDRHTAHIPSPRRILEHLLFWVFSMGLMLLLWRRLFGNTTAAAFILAWTFPIYLASVYFTLFVTLPRALYPRRYAQLVQLVLYTVLGVIFLHTMFFLPLVTGTAALPPIEGYVPPRSAVDLILLSAGVFGVTLIAVVLTLLRHWFEAERRGEQLQRQRLEAELSALRAQVHPHFLFNTLNNLYALTLKKSDQASEVVLKLSALLDYMLYESRAEEVSVEREAELIDSYLDLERMRFGADARIAFRREIHAAQNIAPLLFLPLVENSFKHGMSRSSGEAWVDISLICRTGEISFSVRNSLPGDSASDMDGDDPQGLGLNNVRERLAMLYPGAASFHAARAGAAFEVTMTIKTLTIPTREDR